MNSVQWTITVGLTHTDSLVHYYHSTTLNLPCVSYILTYTDILYYWIYTTSVKLNKWTLLKANCIDIGLKVELEF